MYVYVHEYFFFFSLIILFLAALLSHNLPTHVDTAFLARIRTATYGGQDFSLAEVSQVT